MHAWGGRCLCLAAPRAGLALRGKNNPFADPPVAWQVLGVPAVPEGPPSGTEANRAEAALGMGRNEREEGEEFADVGGRSEASGCGP